MGQKVRSEKDDLIIKTAQRSLVWWSGTNTKTDPSRDPAWKRATLPDQSEGKARGPAAETGSHLRPGKKPVAKTSPVRMPERTRNPLGRLRASPGSVSAAWMVPS